MENEAWDLIQRITDLCIKRQPKRIIQLDGDVDDVEQTNPLIKTWQVQTMGTKQNWKIEERIPWDLQARGNIQKKTDEQEKLIGEPIVRMPT